MTKKAGASMLAKFSEKAQKAIVIAESIAFDLGHDRVGSEHLLLALVKIDESKLKENLQKKKITYEVLRNDLIELVGENDLQPFYMEYSNIMKLIVEKAVLESHKLKEEKVSIEILTWSMLDIKDCVAIKLLNSRNVNIKKLKQQFKNDTKKFTELDLIEDLVNINNKVIEKNITVIGRTKETSKLIHILSRKEKSNALIIGEAGVGKTSLVENLALHINAKKVPPNLLDKTVYELDLTSVIAGTKYRGEFEEKLKKIIKKVKEDKNAIIFIDEIHNLMGAGGAEGAIDASNILKPYLARNEFVCIGATTFDEYYRNIEKDKALERRFQIITLEESTVNETLNILRGIKKDYEKFHNISIKPKLLEHLVKQTNLYIKNRNFPDKALDVLDYACVKAKLSNFKSLTNTVVNEVIEEIANIKITKINKLTSLKENLNKNIKGQDKAIEKIIKHLTCIEHGLCEPQKPRTVMMFVGPTGVGKTEVAKIIAKEYFDNPKHFIRLDMSEFMEPHSISKIIGSPPGYVGHEIQSKFIDEVRQNPFSVVLIDEIEKAHKDVINVFLQVFDEGFLVDSNKSRVDFSNTIIIITSNLGYHHDVFNKTTIGFDNKQDKDNKIINELEKRFNPEFINRIDDIILFETLSKEIYHDLATMYLNNYRDKLNLSLEVSESLIDSIIEMSDIAKYGVRSIQRTIKNNIVPKIITDNLNLTEELNR